MLATGAITYMTVTVPEQDRADANKELNYACADQLKLEREDGDKWESRWFAHQRSFHGGVVSDMAEDIPGVWLAAEPEDVPAVSSPPPDEAHE